MSRLARYGWPRVGFRFPAWDAACPVLSQRLRDDALLVRADQLLTGPRVLGATLLTTLGWPRWRRGPRDKQALPGNAAMAIP